MGGWIDTHGLCTAPPQYAGDCDFKINTTGMTAAEKKNFASKCSVTFPCAGEAPPPAASTGETSLKNGPLELSVDKIKADGGLHGVAVASAFQDRFGRKPGPVDEAG